MRLLFFIHSPSVGGAERVTVNLANHWAAKGWGITIVTLAPASLDFYQIHPTVERIALGLADESRNVLAGLWKNLHRVRALRQVLRQVQPDIALAVMNGIIGGRNRLNPDLALRLDSIVYGKAKIVSALFERCDFWIVR